ncbi:unnamed protein product [Rhizoctonia solani]|uniref:Uncharacterized protein n=1 Tax=Rhizoctonia solani TaxID=456999 RepID=A0A8H3DBR4_9AGAM|nr:unnamed protein product [Rhizoctonia solani]
MRSMHSASRRSTCSTVQGRRRKLLPIRSRPLALSLLTRLPRSPRPLPRLSSPLSPLRVPLPNRAAIPLAPLPRLSSRPSPLQVPPPSRVAIVLACTSLQVYSRPHPAWLSRWPINPL